MSGEHPSLVKKLKAELDELLLQVSLGKAEAADYIEEQKERFAAAMISSIVASGRP